MKTTNKALHAVLCFIVAFTLAAGSAEAQRMKHGASAHRSSQTRSKASVPRGNSINGGHQKSSSRDLSKTTTTKSSVKDNKTNIDRSQTNVKDNKVNIDRSQTNVNVNVDRSRDVNVVNRRTTVVRPPIRPYPRPPYVYGGRRFYCYHPYYYHPYRPFYWGPVWHPWGFFVATLAATAIIVSVENQQYHYDQGVYYVQSGGGYTVVEAPVGATITTLPAGSQTVVVNETTNNYYYGGTYYEKTDKGYAVVPPTAGTVVENLPEGGEEVKIGDVTYVKYGDTYYQPIEKDGKNMYEVVNIEEGEG